jgi:hypothetical protein
MLIQELMHNRACRWGHGESGDIEEPSDRMIREWARKKRISVNKAVISLLQEHMGESERKPVHRYHDLDELAGSWTKQEAQAFDAVLAKQRGIDPEMWK